jgi:salicylate synthase
VTAPLVYHERTVSFGGDPLAAAARLARSAQAPFAVYERDGAWCLGAGAVAEIVLSWDEIRYRTGGAWRVEPVGEAPLRSLAGVLAALPVAGWRAYGWAGFELGPRAHGLAGPRASEPLVHLIVPAREVRLEVGTASLRAVEPQTLDALADQLADAAEPAEAESTLVPADLERGAEDYRRIVARAVDDIHAGRLRKVILSRVVPVDGEIDLVATYERGRRANTPARSFLLDVGGLRATGFSPETVVEVAADGRVSTQPLAGTRARDGGAADGGAADRARREDLLADPKEVYEHAVSVQAAQDELRAVCDPATVVVDEFMSVLERGSVQHLASRVSGRLASGNDAWDALAVVFPSITAIGIPKTAAYGLIRDYESAPRGLYSGAVLSVGADGALDAALVLRTVFQRDGRTWLRAGAGIVGASRPERELEETREKLRSVSRFLVAAPPPAAGPAVPTGPDRDGLRRTVAAHLYTEFDRTGSATAGAATAGADGQGVDPARLSAAIERLVDRHESLRTRVTDNGGQIVEARSGWRGLTVHDLRDLDEATAGARLEETRDRLSHQMLDIEHGEVLSTALSLLPGGATRFHLDVDMVAADAVSYRALLADLARLYGRPDEVEPAPAYTYRRYRAEHEAGRKAAASRAREAWMDRLPSLPGPPELALAAPRPATSQPGGAESGGGSAVRSLARVSRRHFRLSPRSRAALGRESHRRGVTPAMAVATAFAEVLGVWSTQSRFLLNVPLFDREQLHPDVDRVVGDFTSSVLLEVDLTDRVPFVERARRVQTRLHADASHADASHADASHADASHAGYSGVEILRDAGRPRGEQVLAPVVFTSALGLGELFDAAVREEFGTPEWIISQGPQVLLDAQVTELDGGLLVNWDIREDAFAPGTVDAMFAAFERVVRDLAEPTAEPAASAVWERPFDAPLDAATTAVRRQVGDVAGPAATRLLHEGFFAHAERRPEAPALVWGDVEGPAGTLTYGGLAARAADIEAADIEAADTVGEGR